MQLNEIFPVSPAKLSALKEKIKVLGVEMDKIEESFVRGRGPGGQKINKTSSCVVLSYPPLGLVVKMQESRQRPLNRFLALRELVEQIEMKISPQTSGRLKEIQKIRKQKARRSRRHREKAPPAPAPLEFPR